jgi:hypothetical protein
MKDQKPYGDLTALNTCRDMLDTVGKDTLERIVFSFLEFMETSSAIYEIDGSYAASLFTSSFCRFLDAASQRLCNTDNPIEALQSGKWVCHESCWTKASRISIETGKPYDLKPCDGGINIYAIPIRAGERIIGSINFGYGDPPTDEKAINELASKYKTDKKELLLAAKAYKHRPDYITNATKKLLHVVAELIGEIYIRKKMEKGFSEKLDEVERFNKLMVARELMMGEMKKEIQNLKLKIRELEAKKL